MTVILLEIPWGLRVSLELPQSPTTTTTTTTTAAICLFSFELTEREYSLGLLAI